MALIPEVQDKWPYWPERFLLSPSSHKWQEDGNIWDPRVRWWLEIQGACSSHMQPLNWPGGLPRLHHPWEVGTVPINSSRRETPRMNDTSYVWKLLQPPIIIDRMERPFPQTIPQYPCHMKWHGVEVGWGGPPLHRWGNQHCKRSRTWLKLSSFDSHLQSFHSVLLLLANWNEWGLSSCGSWALVAPEIKEKSEIQEKNFCS